MGSRLRALFGRRRAAAIARRASSFTGAVNKGYFRVRDGLTFLEKDPFVRAILVVAFAVTVFQIWVDLDDRRDERQMRQEERIARAWSILTTPASGNSGKAAALQTLYRAGISLRGIDLSCETMGGGWHEETLTCDRPVDLTGVDLSGPNAPRRMFTDKSSADESGDWRKACLAETHSPDPLEFGDLAFLSSEPLKHEIARPYFALRKTMREGGVDLRGARLSGVDLTGARLSGANFAGADLRGAIFDRTIAEAAVFDDARLAGAEIRQSFLSGSQFRASDWSCNRSILGAPSNEACPIATDAQKARITNSWLDGAEFLYRRADGFQITYSSAINSIVEFGSFPDLCSNLAAIMTNTTCTAETWANLVFAGNDFECSIILNDSGIRLGASNISRVLFPPRYRRAESAQVADTSLPEVYETEIGRRGWDADDHTLPWAWADRPPKGHLNGELVAQCKPNSERLDWSRGLVQRAPQDCETFNPKYFERKKVTLFAFPEPPLARVHQNEIEWLTDDVISMPQPATQ